MAFFQQIVRFDNSMHAHKSRHVHTKEMSINSSELCDPWPLYTAMQKALSVIELWRLHVPKSCVTRSHRVSEVLKRESESVYTSH